MELRRGWPFLVRDSVERSDGICAILGHGLYSRLDQSVVGPQHFVGVQCGVVSEEDLIGRKSGGGIDPVVMYHCGQCKPMCPSFWIIRGDQSEILFDPLVLSF